MNLKFTWNLRQIILDYLAYIVCPTAVFVVYPLVTKSVKYYQYSDRIYPAHWLAHVETLHQYNDLFWQTQLYPVLLWLPLTLLGDIAVRRFLYGLYR